MNQDISICVLTEDEMGWTEPFELDKVQILDNYYLIIIIFLSILYNLSYPNKAIHSDHLP